MTKTITAPQTEKNNDQNNGHNKDNSAKDQKSGKDTKPQQQSQTDPAKTAKEQALAKALRDNLKKRKQQMKKRKEHV